jgi:prepilin-type N-terminal cleavage/methylation domain-containing protein
MKSLNRGFTLIELLVVIAIIGILSAVVLGQLNSARSKGADASIKSNLNNIRARAQLLYELSAGNNYNGICLDSNISAMVTAAGGSCSSANQQWRASAPLKYQTGWWCVDATGIPKLEGSDPSSGNSCP